MRIHSSVITSDDIHAAARTARVSYAGGAFTVHGSRKRDRAFNVLLTGESRRRPNGGNRGAGDDYAATWDQWGIFLAALYAVDPNMVTPYYVDAEDFAHRTADRFGAPEVTMTSDGYREVFVAYGWPEDAHGDHRFVFVGTPREQECKTCTAVARW